MRLTVDPTSDEPLHVQIAGGIRSNIADGTLEPGERLPAARELADDLGVNVHTVLRAYRALCDEELLEMRRARGTLVRDGASLGEMRSRAELGHLVARLLNEARIQGVTRDEVLDLIREKW